MECYSKQQIYVANLSVENVHYHLYILEATVHEFYRSCSQITLRLDEYSSLNMFIYQLFKLNYYESMRNNAKTLIKVRPAHTTHSELQNY